MRKRSAFQNWLLKNKWIHPLAFRVFRAYWFLFRPQEYGVKCVIEHGGEILMIRNTYGRKLWTFPGGGVDAGETSEEAVEREVSEEVGIHIRHPRKIGMFTSTLEFKKDTVTVFATEVFDKNFRIDTEEILEAQWFSPENLPIISEYAKKIISMWNRQEI